MNPYEPPAVDELREPSVEDEHDELRSDRRVGLFFIGSAVAIVIGQAVIFWHKHDARPVVLAAACVGYLLAFGLHFLLQSLASRDKA